MPQTQSATRALRGAMRRRVINDRWRRKFRESVKAVMRAVTTQDAAAATELYKKAQSNLDKAVQHHILHRNAAARKKAQLETAVAKIKK